MWDSIAPNWWMILIGILSGIIVIENAWSKVFLPLVKHFGFYKKSKDASAIELINEKLDAINIRLDESDKHKQDERELQQLILEGVTASLQGLKSLGCNGPVTSANNKIDEYKNLKAVQ